LFVAIAMLALVRWQDLLSIIDAVNFVGSLLLSNGVFIKL
jgi:hypothetical protein